ncbi:MAG: hypothetical protein AB7F19_04645 [Candidatus Babeliales bacterium]
MYLRLAKATEDNESVSYWVETTAKDPDVTEHVLKTVKGFCIFNKNTEVLSFDVIKTDSFYLLRPMERAYILYRLKQYNKASQGFPTLFDIATG